MSYQLLHFEGVYTGPTLFIIFINDLRSVGLTKSLTKYADNTLLMVPEKTDVEMAEEFSSIIKWSSDNNC